MNVHLINLIFYPIKHSQAANEEMKMGDHSEAETDDV
jgi:hypothetical protein